MKAEKKQMKAMSLICILPLVISCAISWLIVLLAKRAGYVIDCVVMIEIVKTMLGIWGTLLGFIITAVSILIGFNGNERTKDIMNSRHYKTILYTYMITCFTLLLCIAIFIPVVMINKFSLNLLYIFSSTLIITLIYVFLCLLYLTLIIVTALKKKNNN